MDEHIQVAQLHARIVQRPLHRVAGERELALGVGLRQARSVDIGKAMKTAGFDWLFIDMEHNAMDIDIATQIAAGLAAVYPHHDLVALGCRLVRIAEHLGAPVATTLQGLSAFPGDHPLHAGFSFGPSAAEMELQFNAARDAWKDRGKPAPWLGTGFWYALGPDARDQMNAYLERYLNFMAPVARDNVKQICIATTPQALKDAVQQAKDAGADDVLLVPTTSDPDDVHRVQDILA